MRFDSQGERDHYMLLEFDEAQGLITDLARQVRFLVIPKHGNERAAHYIADFMYRRDGKLVVEDFKGMKKRTADYILKRKLMNFVCGIEIQEV